MKPTWPFLVSIPSYFSSAAMSSTYSRLLPSLTVRRISRPTARSAPWPQPWQVLGLANRIAPVYTMGARLRWGSALQPINAGLLEIIGAPFFPTARRFVMPQAWRAGNPEPAAGSGEATGRVPSPVPAMETPGFAVPCGPQASKTKPSRPRDSRRSRATLDKTQIPKDAPTGGSWQGVGQDTQALGRGAASPCPRFWALIGSLAIARLRICFWIMVIIGRPSLLTC